VTETASQIVPSGTKRAKVGTPSVVSRTTGLPRPPTRACLVDRECHAGDTPFSLRGWPPLRASARRAERPRASAAPSTCLAARRTDTARGSTPLRPVLAPFGACPDLGSRPPVPLPPGTRFSEPRRRLPTSATWIRRTGTPKRAEGPRAPVELSPRCYPGTNRCRLRWPFGEFCPPFGLRAVTCAKQLTGRDVREKARRDSRTMLAHVRISRIVTTYSASS
jgi:hypothetical protein